MEEEYFDMKIRPKVFNALKRLYELNNDNRVSEDDAVNLNNCSVLDNCHISMCIAKSKRAKRVLSLFIEANNNKVPNLDYTIRKSDENKKSTSSYDVTLVAKILNVFKSSSDKEMLIKISVKENYPITFENEDFKVLLAPRIED